MNEIVRLTLIPIIAAASRSCAVARIAFPCRVRCTSHMSAKSTGTVNRMTMNLFHVYGTPPMVNTVPVGRMSGTEVGRAPFQISPMFWRMNDIPIAVIRGASRGALRKRR